MEPLQGFLSILIWSLIKSELNQDLVIDQLALKLDSLFTEDELEQNLELIVKMNLNHEIPLASICEHQEIAKISSDLNLIKKVCFWMA